MKKKKRVKNSYIKTTNIYKFSFLLILFLGIGYAVLTTNLGINGTVTTMAPKVNVYVQSASVTTGSTSGTPTIIGNDKKEVDFTTALTSDGSSFYEEVSTLINRGTQSAYLNSVDVHVYDGSNEISLAYPYEYTITHGDGSVVEVDEELTVNGTQTYKIRFNYENGTDMTTVTTYPSYTFKVIYNFTKGSDYLVTFNDNILPSGYQRVEYIESTGTQYIDTDYIPKTTTKLELDLSFNGQFKCIDDYGGKAGILGIYDSNTQVFSINFGGHSNQGNQLYPWFNKRYQYEGTQAETITITDEIRTNRNTLTIENESVTYGTVTRTITSKQYDQVSSMYLFGLNSIVQDVSAGPFTAYNMRVYEMKIYENNILVRHYLPCIDETTGKAGLYEVIDGVFYGNIGTGDFNYSDVNGMTSKVVTYGSEYGSLPVPTRSGYTFKGWNGKNKFDINSSAGFTSSILDWTQEKTIDGFIVDASKISGVARGMKLSLGELPAGTYIINSINNASPIKYQLRVKNSQNESKRLTISEPSMLELYIVCRPSEYIFSKIQLEEGTVATEYEPYYLTSSTKVTQDKNHTLTAIWEAN